MLTEAMSLEDPELVNYRDTYLDRLAAVIERKVKGRKIVDPTAAPVGDRVLQLMDALERSLKKAKSGHPTKRWKAS